MEQVAFSPDGSLLAVATSIGVYLYDAETLDMVRFIETEEWVRSVAFSPDGLILAVGLEDGTVRLWQTTDGSPMRTLKGHTDYTISVPPPQDCP